MIKIGRLSCYIKMDTSRGYGDNAYILIFVMMFDSRYGTYLDWIEYSFDHTVVKKSVNRDEYDTIIEKFQPLTENEISFVVQECKKFIQYCEDNVRTTNRKTKPNHR